MDAGGFRIHFEKSTCSKDLNIVSKSEGPNFPIGVTSRKSTNCLPNCLLSTGNPYHTGEDLVLFLATFFFFKRKKNPHCVLIVDVAAARYNFSWLAMHARGYACRISEDHAAGEGRLERRGNIVEISNYSARSVYMIKDN